MNRLHAVAALAVAPLLVSFHVAVGQPAARANMAGDAAELDLRQADLAQAQAAQSADPKALSAQLHPSYAAHLPDGRLFNYDQTLAFASTGALAKERFERRQESVVVTGDVGVVMGLDKMASAPPLAKNGELNRRYTNVYVREDGRWKLVARHFHFLP